MPSPVLGGREARRLERTAAGPTGTVEGRTCGDFRRLQAVHSAGLLAGEVGLVSTREDSAFRATQGKLVGSVMFSEGEIGIETAEISAVRATQGALMGSVMFGAEEIGEETAEIAFLSETQYMEGLIN